MQNRTFLYIGLMVIALIGGLLLWKNSSLKAKSPQSPPLAITISTPSPVPQIFKLAINQGKATPEIISVKEGETVRIEILSDIEDELHIHGIDKEVKLEKSKPVLIEFLADKTGRFIMELHEADKEIGAIEVSPK